MVEEVPHGRRAPLCCGRSPMVWEIPRGGGGPLWWMISLLRTRFPVTDEIPCDRRGPLSQTRSPVVWEIPPWWMRGPQ